ncbi:hypothetical protein CFN78_08545 [Amycolatopsis antarctica]|uniref:Uncharacterized protein n=1 Tax=Amycolatopsis antarctica TaxID=1854586 RepID=A0A263D501_9PSEU|nr:hypothetical protein [Amycolatopsis antarctica]OZM73572.1 hypothetical protein CFN78_08545 [Amycolatopsis antarctica]
MFGKFLAFVYSGRYLHGVRLAVADVTTGGTTLISRSGLNDLIGDYEKAHRLLDQVVSILEDASVMISGAGEGFTRQSVDMINHGNDLCVQLRKVRDQLKDVTPDD